MINQNKFLCLLNTFNRIDILNIKIILIDKTYLEWNCCNEEDKNSPNYEMIEYLDMNFYLIIKQKIILIRIY